MFASQQSLATIGQNIANANTPGYSRQSVVLTTPPGQFTGSGFFGKGVAIQTVTRAHNDFLTSQAQSSKSVASMDQARSDLLNQLQKLFPTGTNGLGSAAGDFFNSMVDVSNSPSDPSARQVVIGKAQALAARFSDAGQQIDAMQAGVVSDLKADVATVNQLATQIANANNQIALATGTGQQPNDLLDQRDQLISQLSQYLQVTTLPASDGSLSVFIGGGQRLVLGGQALQLSVTQDTYDPTHAAVSINESNGSRQLDSSVLTGGSITARLQFQNTDLADASNKLGQLAAAIGTRVNQQQALGLDLSNPPGTGAAMFSFGQPRALPASTNARNSDGTYATSVGLTIANASQLQASNYTLQVDPAGSGGYLLTRQSDGLQRVVQNGDTVDGFQINITGNAMAAGDSFQLQPVSRAAVNMQTVLTSPSGIAAASPLTASVATTNTGTATVNTIYAVNSNLDTTQAPMTLTFGDPDPNNTGQVLYNLQLADGTVLSGSWAAGQPIGNQPNATPPINLGFELTLNGVPKSGDVVTISPTKFTANNNGNAQAFLNIQSSTFIGQQLNPDGSVSAGSTVNDAYASAMSDIGARVQGATYQASVSSSVSTQAETARSNDAGVNIDEEAARLMQFQQSYQAAAKVLQTAQTLFNQLLQIVGS